jgi:predicted DNA-binding protein (UPF0251 family)
MSPETPVRFSTQEQAALVGLSQGYTWAEIGQRMQISKRTVARYVASARVKLGFNPKMIIERSSLIQRAAQAGLVQPGMKLGTYGYIVMSVTQHSPVDPAYYFAKGMEPPSD